MRNGYWLAAAGIVLGGAAFLATPASRQVAQAEEAGATVTGKVTWNGPVPEPMTMDVTKDNEKCECSAKDPSKRSNKKVMEHLVIDSASKGVANCVVWLKGAKGGPALTAEVDQKGCEFVPHVALVTVGSKVKVLNPDKIAHNYHWWSKLNNAENVSIPKFKPSVEVPADGFQKAEFMRVTCDVHPWMFGWIAVMENGYAARTDATGAFRIAGVPPGKYTLALWHEPATDDGKPFMTEKEITVEAGKGASADFTLPTP